MDYDCTRAADLCREILLLAAPSDPTLDQLLLLREAVLRNLPAVISEAEQMRTIDNEPSNRSVLPCNPLTDAPTCSRPPHNAQVTLAVAASPLKPCPARLAETILRNFYGFGCS